MEWAWSGATSLGCTGSSPRSPKKWGSRTMLASGTATYIVITGALAATLLAT